MSSGLTLIREEVGCSNQSYTTYLRQVTKANGLPPLKTIYANGFLYRIKRKHTNADINGYVIERSNTLLSLAALFAPTRRYEVR